MHHGDGLVDQQLFTLPVRAKPADIPTVVEVDITDLTIGGALRVADLNLPAGVTTELEDDVAIVTGQPPRVQALEGEEGEAEAAAEGTEPQAEAAASADTAGED